MSTARETLDSLIRRSGLGYAGASRLIGKNPAYIQQYIKRGVPRQLSEIDRRTLAFHLGVSEELLGAPPRTITPASSIPPDVAPSAAPGIPYLENPDERQMPIPNEILHMFGKADGLLALKVSGDAMAPTLLHDDRLVISTNNCEPVRDGLYLITLSGLPVVKRIALHPNSGMVNIISDNSIYPDFTNFPASDLSVIGRVIWVSRLLV